MNCIRRMDHFTVVTDRLAQTQAFYERLGLQVGARPDFGIGGVWLYAGEQAVLHVVEVQHMPALRRGALDHMAFHGDDIVATLEMLKREGVAYRLLRLPRPWSTWQVFFEDPNGAEVEIDFDAAQKVPPHLKDGSVAQSSAS
ncbi:VOC family protein [Azohydromonas lata]|jgi:catechol 2,3-dioxygenase-like lactoylglutathione lyase family enzyme|uniref:VOC family protein n=2 Tax=Azohydromonas TaxID=312063 RepID=A0ABU5I7Q6_9BURK|nr:VOC family protein [Azohydromonas lata]MDZ5455132.1 VOC family protein [Azohydromonas lata]